MFDRLEKARGDLDHACDLANRLQLRFRWETEEDVEAALHPDEWWLHDTAATIHALRRYARSAAYELGTAVRPQTPPDEKMRDMFMWIAQGNDTIAVEDRLVLLVEEIGHLLAVLPEGLREDVAVAIRAALLPSLPENVWVDADGEIVHEDLSEEEGALRLS